MWAHHLLFVFSTGLHRRTAAKAHDSRPWLGLACGNCTAVTRLTIKVLPPFRLLPPLRFPFCWGSPYPTLQSSAFMSGMKIVFTGNPNLMFDFNSFLSRWNPVTFEESLDFVKKVKARDYQLYLSLSDILSQKEQTPPEIYHNDHDDLCKELMRFKPHVRERRINKHNSFGMSLLLMSVFLLSLFLMFEQPLRYVVQQAFGT
ncbi:uncharacterized protein LOC135586100 isoform X3 [Musa acuminata AAA Group]